jgi:hypothetical protein
MDNSFDYIDVILDALGNHKNSAKIQAEGFDALTTFISDENSGGGMNEGLIAKIVQKGGLKLIIHAMTNEKFEDAPGVLDHGCLIYGCLILDNLSYTRDSQHTSKIFTSIKRIYECLLGEGRRLSGRIKIEEVLDSLAQTIATLTIQAVISSIIDYLEVSLKVVFDHCDTLMNLSKSRKNQEKILKFGGIECIIQALKAHIRSDEASKSRFLLALQALVREYPPAKEDLFLQMIRQEMHISIWELMMNGLNSPLFCIQDIKEYNLLHFAVYFNDFDLVKFVLRHDPTSIHYLDDNGDLPIQKACGKFDDTSNEMIQCLLQSSLSLRTDESCGGLFNTVSHKKTSILHQLINACHENAWDAIERSLSGYIHKLPFLHQIIQYSPQHTFEAIHRFPDSLFIGDEYNRLPIHVALENGMTDYPIELSVIIIANQSQLKEKLDPVTKLPAIALASTKCELRIIYDLLCKYPESMASDYTIQDEIVSETAGASDKKLRNKSQTKKHQMPMLTNKWKQRRMGKHKDKELLRLKQLRRRKDNDQSIRLIIEHLPRFVNEFKKIG